MVGREHAPLLMNWLTQQSGVEVVAGPADPEAAVRERKVEFVLVVDKEFAAKFRESQPAPVQVVSDSTSQSTRSKVVRLNSLLNAFSAETGGMRLISRGVSPVIVRALKVDQLEVATAQQRAAMIFNFIPMFLVIALFTSGMPIASDSTAGERERGSLEPLLLNPIPRGHLVAGKWLAAGGAALLGMLTTMAIMLVVLSRLALEELGVRNHIGTPQVLLLAAVVPLALVSPAIQMFVACFAKSFKESQSYLGLLASQPGRPLALFAPRRIGKTYFLDQDLSPAARAHGWLPVYADLWLQRDNLSASDRAAYLTVAVIPLDGGMLRSA